jgi:uncharacterized protein YegL
MRQTIPGSHENAPVHVSFLLDRSGSMGAIREDVIGGFNQFLRQQQGQPGTCRMTLVQFDTQAPFEVLADAVDVQAMPALDAGRYQPRGGTPLLDALGQLLEHAERRARGRDEDAIVVVFTDGHENASRTWTRAALFERIAALQERGWTFVFLGANQDSYAEAGALGFAAGSTSNWNPRSPEAAFAQTSRAIGSYRSKGAWGRRSQSGDFFEGIKEAEADEADEASGAVGSDPTRKRVKH